MKSTYKLLGLHWDHHPIPERFPVFVENKCIEKYLVDRNLLDYQTYERRVDISEMFTCNKEQLLTIASKMKVCDGLYLNVDYAPESRARVVREFFSLRLLQAVAFLERNTKKDVKVIAPNEIKHECFAKWTEKTRSDE